MPYPWFLAVVCPVDSGDSVLAIFAYYPMYGVIIAFKDFNSRRCILGSPWADPIFKYFQQFFSTPIAVTTIKNTILLALEQLVISFPIRLSSHCCSTRSAATRQERLFRPSLTHLTSFLMLSWSALCRCSSRQTVSSTMQLSHWAATFSPSSPVKITSAACTSVPLSGSRWLQRHRLHRSSDRHQR